MDGIYGPGKAVVAHLGHLGRLRFCQPGVGGYHPDGGVGPCQGVYRRRFGQDLEGIRKRNPVFFEGPRQDLSRLGVDDITEAVYGHDGTHHEVPHAAACHTQASLHDVSRSPGLSHRGTRTGPDVSLIPVVFPGIQAGLVSHGFIGPDIRPAHGEVKKDGGGDNGDNPHPHGKSYSLFLQVLHDPRCRVQAVGASAGKTDGVNLFDKVNRVEAVGFPGSRAAAPDINTGGDAIPAEDDGYPRSGFIILGMPNLDAR